MLPSRSDSRHLLSFQALPPDTETDIDTDKPTEPNPTQTNYTKLTNYKVNTLVLLLAFGCQIGKYGNAYLHT